MVAQKATEEREAARLLEPAAGGADDLGADREMPERSALLAQLDLGAIGELPHLADVVHDRGGHQEVRVEPGMQLAELADQRRDRHRVLDQPAEVSVVAGAGARSAAKLGPVVRLREVDRDLVVA